MQITADDLAQQIWEMTNGLRGNMMADEIWYW